jgi:tetratricopeptide (TPR) repeat protein
MTADSTPDPKFELGHVLFIDIVGYSKLLINEQSEHVHLLSELVRSTEQARSAQSEGKLVQLPTGDGVALVFRTSPEAPARCALQFSKALQSHPNLRVRMGIHSGPVNVIKDVNERANITGAGINIAQRVMDCGDAGHILLSKRAAEDLQTYREWQQYLHDLGECEVKHGVRVGVVNLYTQTLGNSRTPQKIKQSQSAVLRPGSILTVKHLIGAGALVLFVLGIIVWLVRAQHWQAGVIQKQSEQVTAVVGRYEKMQQVLVRLAEVESHAKQPGSKMSPEEQRAAAYATMERDLGLPVGSLAKELPAFALELYNRADTTPLMRARAAYALNKFDEAEKLSLEGAAQDRQAYETAQRVQEERRKRAIESYTLAGQSAQKRIQYTEAMQHFHEAEKLSDRDRDPTQWADVESAIGQLLLDQGKYSDAENVLRAVVDIRAHALGAEHPETLRSRNRYALALARLGRNAEAEVALDGLIKLEGKVLGPEHPDTIASRMNLALAILEHGRYSEAEAQYREILRLTEKVLGPEHPETLKTHNNLAYALWRKGSYLGAETEFRALLRVEEKVLGSEHPDTLMARSNLGGVLEDQGKYAEAEAEDREVIKLKEKVLGPEHPDTLKTRNNLAGTLLDDGKYAEAEVAFSELVKLEGKVLGPEHPDTLLSRMNLALVLYLSDQCAEADAECRELIKLQDKTLGPEHPRTLETRWVLAGALRAQYKYAESEAQYRELTKVQERVLGAEHPDTLNSRSGLAKTLMDQGKDATVEMREVIRLKEKVSGPTHPDTLTSYYDFADSLKRQGKIQEGKEFARRAAEGGRKVLGPEHPNTKKYEKLLADLESKQ